MFFTIGSHGVKVGYCGLNWIYQLFVRYTVLSSVIHYSIVSIVSMLTLYEKK